MLWKYCENITDKTHFLIIIIPLFLSLLAKYCKRTEFIVVIGTIQSYLVKWGERLNFGNTVAETVRKSMREEKVEWCDWEGEKMNFRNDITEIHSTAQALPLKCPSGSGRMIYQLWQPSCRNCRDLRREKIWIVATKFLKMGGEIKVVAEIWGGI